jgi:GNAT superfamily N-acetyltransferase
VGEPIADTRHHLSREVVMQAAHLLDLQPVTVERFEHLAALFATGLPRACWHMEPRVTAAEEADSARRWRAEGIPRKTGRREAFRSLLSRPHPPGLLAYRDGDPVGWVSVGPRGDYPRIDRSRALPPLDELPVWAIPCLYVQPEHRDQGCASALLRAAVQHAGRHGAPAVEGYPRARDGEVAAEDAYYGTVAMFAAAGFEVARPPLSGLPRNWTPRYTMRARCAPPRS